MIEYVGGDIVVLLVLAHLAGDFVLQSDRAVEAKRAGQAGAHMYHAVVHAALAYLCVGLWTLWLLPIVIGLTHGGIDWLKEGIVRRVESLRGDLRRGSRAVIFAVDQALHLAVILAAAVLLVDPLAIPAWIELYGESAIIISLVLIGLIVTTWGGAVAVGFAAEPYLAILKASVERESDGACVTREPDADSAAAVRRGFPRGGRTIGQLERALVFLFVITGNMTGVGFLVAAKSVFRFGEITQPTQRKEAEYILIGTLMSFTWALFAATLTRWLIDALVVG